MTFYLNSYRGRTKQPPLERVRFVLEDHAGKLRSVSPMSSRRGSPSKGFLLGLVDEVRVGRIVPRDSPLLKAMLECFRWVGPVVTSKQVNNDAYAGPMSTRRRSQR